MSECRRCTKQLGHDNLRKLMKPVQDFTVCARLNHRGPEAWTFVDREGKIRGLTRRGDGEVVYYNKVVPQEDRMLFERSLEPGIIEIVTVYAYGLHEGKVRADIRRTVEPYDFSHPRMDVVDTCAISPPGQKI